MLELLIGIPLVLGFLFALACSLYAPLGIWVYFKWQAIIDHEKAFWASRKKGKR